MIIRAKAVSEVSSCLRPSVPAVPKKSQSGRDDDEKMHVSEAKILVSEASKLFAGAIIFRGP